MKNLIVLGAVSLLLFSISAGLSLWLNDKKSTEAAEATEPSEGHDKNRQHSAKGGDHISEKSSHDPSSSLKTGGSHADHSVEKSTPLPNLTAVNEREKQLREQEDRMNLLLADMVDSRNMYDQMHRELNKELDELVKSLQTLKNKVNTLENQKVSTPTPPQISSPSTGKKETPATDKKSLSQLAKIYGAMPPEKAATIITQLADSGQLETAGKVMSLMEQRQAANIIAKLEDASLAAQLMDKILEASQKSAAEK